MATVHHHLTANTLQMASPLIPLKCIKIPASKTPLPLPMEKTGSRAPIVVSELEEEEMEEDMEEDLLVMSVEGDEAEEERDDLEELRDFQSILMPAARESAARRLNALNNAGGREKAGKEGGGNQQNGHQIHRRQRPAHQKGVKVNPFVASKFPVIDEDLLALATRKGANGNGNGNPPPNLCRLITNVSECRWTTKRPTSPIRGTKEDKKAEEKEKMSENAEGEMPKFAMRRQQLDSANSANSNNSSFLLRTPTAHNEAAALRRLSALSMVSSVSSYGQGGALEDAANCDCTSLAISAFRRSAFNNLSGKRRKQLEARKRAEGRMDLDDSYRKISPSTSSTMNAQSGSNSNGAAANDSGISSSSESSRSTSLSEGTNSSTTIQSKRNCTNCGRKFLPPSAKRPANSQSAVLLSRRRRALNYLLGNMMRFLEMPSSKKCECQRCGGGAMNLKLISSPMAAPSTTVLGNVPMISIEMVPENGREKVKEKEIK